MERAAWVALSSITGLGPARFKRLLAEFGTALEALERDPEEVCQAAGLPESCAEEVGGLPRQLERVSEELASLDEAGVYPLLWSDAEYPARLLATTSPPPVLWWTGEADLNGQAVAVIGSREVSEAAGGLAGEMAEELVRAGVLVVSGLAAGIDAAAHLGAMAGEGETVGVCGCGLGVALSKGTEGLAGRVARSGGLCSELSPAAPLRPAHLFARDRIIAGLAQAVVVVAARGRGGAVHTAESALREGRPVFAVEWAQERWEGNGELLAAGASPLPAARGAAAEMVRTVLERDDG